MENIKKLVDNIIIYGVGKTGKAYIDKCLSCGLDKIKLCLTDSNSRLWGENYRGVQIQSPDAALADNVDMVVIAVGYNYKEEI